MKRSIPKPMAMLAGLALAAAAQSTQAQMPVTSFSGYYISAPSTIAGYLALPAGLIGAFLGCSSSNYNYTFSNGSSNQYKLNSFNAGGNTYFVAPASAAVVKLRRVDNSNAAGNRSILYMECTASSALACPSGGALSFKPPYIDVMEDLLDAGMLNQGTDNVFTNASNGDGNNNNIERVDVIFSSGLNTSAPGQAGFAIFDRGSNYQHDPFRIAAITGVDAAGNPTSFGPVKTCTGGNSSNSNGSWGHPSTAAGNHQFATYVMRKDQNETKLRASSNVNQEIGGVFYTFASLGITPNQPLYGYALLGPDGLANPASALLLDLNNSSVYPTNTTEANGGGLDLVAVNTVFATASYIVLPLSVTSFTADRQSGQASLQWSLGNTSGKEVIALQRSTDGLTFTTICTTTASQYIDQAPPNIPTWYYRLQIANDAGQIAYSQILTLHDDQTAARNDWRIYPTMISTGQTLQLDGLPDNNYTVSCYDLGGAGRTLKVRVTNKKGLVDPGQANLVPGHYWLKIAGHKGIAAFTVVR